MREVGKRAARVEMSCAFITSWTLVPLLLLSCVPLIPGDVVNEVRDIYSSPCSDYPDIPEAGKVVISRYPKSVIYRYRKLAQYSVW